MLMPRSCTLVCFPTQCVFTGEHPVVYINPFGQQMGYGVATAAQISLPVSSFRTPWAGWPDAIVDGNEELARLNWAVLSFPTSQELLLNPDIDTYPLRARPYSREEATGLGRRMSTAAVRCPSTGSA
jgi:hypothetical protein